jgi:hypothetical protein
MTDEQQKQFTAWLDTEIHTTAEAINWVEKEFDLSYSDNGMCKLPSETLQRNPHAVHRRGRHAPNYPICLLTDAHRYHQLRKKIGAPFFQARSQMGALRSGARPGKATPTPSSRCRPATRSAM